MPNFKIIQDVADQARVKIYGSQDIALNTDSAGNLSITGPTGGLLVTAPTDGFLVTASADGLSVTGPTGGLLVTAPTDGFLVTASADGLSVTGPTGGLLVTAPTDGFLVTASADGLSVTGPTGGLLVTAPTDGLLVTASADGLSVTGPTGGLLVTAPTDGFLVTASADGLSVTGPTGGLLVTAPTDGLLVTASADGLSVTGPTGGLLITSAGLAVVSALATTDVTEAKTGIIDTAGSASDTYVVLAVNEYTFGLVNEATSAANAQATAILQISPNGTTWFNNGSTVTLSPGTSGAVSLGHLPQICPGLLRSSKCNQCRRSHYFLPRPDVIPRLWQNTFLGEKFVSSRVCLETNSLHNRSHNYGSIMLILAYRNVGRSV